jgi:GDP-4-dehydro-6-deoxy-D-mannose reductase
MIRECEARGDAWAGTYRPGEPVPSADAPWFPLDLLEPDSIRHAFDAFRPEGIVHLAGQANVSRAQHAPIEAFRVNAEGTLHVLDGLRTVIPSARAVVVTSAEVYGAVPPARLPVDEDQELAPGTPYGASKAAADIVAGQAARGWGLHVVRMRPFNHVGPGQRLGFVAPDFASQVARIERGAAEPVMRVGNLSARRDFTDVRDIVRGYRNALDDGRAGAAYNLCRGESTPIEDILRFFVSRSRVPIEVRRDESRVRPVDVPEFRGDPSRARRELGWAARRPLHESLDEVLEEWRAAPVWATDLAD